MKEYINLFVASPMEQFEINEFITFNAPLLGSFKLSLTNIGFYLIIVSLLVLGLLYISSNNNNLIPSKWNIFQEGIYSSILNIVRDQIGPSKELYLPFIYTLFIFVLLNNLVGLVPYSFTPTSHLLMTISISVTIFLGVTILGLVQHGLGFFAFFIPAGTPLALVPLLVPLELVSYFARALSLGVRLGANIIAGHALLKIISTFTWQLTTAGPIIFIISLLPIAFLTALFGLELGIAFLQAYVITILTCSYLKDAIYLH